MADPVVWPIDLY